MGALLLLRLASSTPDTHAPGIRVGTTTGSSCALGGAEWYCRAVRWGGPSYGYGAVGDDDSVVTPCCVSAALLVVPRTGL